MLPWWFWFSRSNYEAAKDKADELIHGEKVKIPLLFWAGLVSVGVLIYKIIFR